MKDTHESITPPARVPEPGFYYHYKHDPDGAVNHYAYYIWGVGHHTEADARPEDKFQQTYWPLYDTALVYQLGKMFDLRPLEMAMDTVDVDGYHGPRFVKIEDEDIIAQLQQIGREMYGPWPW